MSNKQDFWKKVIGEEWYIHLKDLLDSPYMDNFMKFISNEYDSSSVLPDKKDIFKAFRLCDFSNLKVVIIGQDPYFDGSATGLAFANKEDTMRMNPSLMQIRNCIERECYDGMLLEFDYTLENWAEQGILLLNTALTVKKYSPTSHTQLWSKFTDFLLEVINEDTVGIHFCFWGNHAKSYHSKIDDNRHYKYFDVHPSYCSRNNTDWKCTHFNDINKQILENNGEDEIITW